MIRYQLCVDLKFVADVHDDSCRRAGGGQGGNPMGPMGGPMDFGRNKSKFQEVPETGITFDDVAVSLEILCAPLPYGVVHFSFAGAWFMD